MGRLYPKMRERPQEFRINYDAPLAEGLVFAGLGGQGCVGSMVYPDSSPYHHNGTLVNMDAATDWVWSPELERWVLEGNRPNKAYIKNDLATPWQGAFTVALFARTTSVDNVYSSVFNTTGTNYNNYYGFQIDHQNGEYTFFSDFAAVPTLSLSIGPYSALAWHHVAASYDASYVRVYYDGSQSDQVSAIQGAWNTVYAYECFRNRMAIYYTSGLVADVMMWSRALTPSEISALADPSNVDLRVSGVPLILPPRRRFWPVVSEQALPKMVPWHLFQQVGV